METTTPKSSKPGVFTHVYRRAGTHRSSPAPHSQLWGKKDHFVTTNGNPSTSEGPKNSNSAQGFQGGSCRTDVLGFRLKETGNLISDSGFDEASKRVSGRSDATDDSANKLRRIWVSGRRDATDGSANKVFSQINEDVARKLSPNASSNTVTAAQKVSPNTYNLRPPVAAATMVRPQEVKPENCIQDEDESRKERRREANRESARRLRFRKQEECNKLQEVAQGLKSETSSLRKDLMRLSEECMVFEIENKSITEEIIQRHGRGAISDLEAEYPELFQRYIDDKNSKDTEIKSPR